MYWLLILAASVVTSFRKGLSREVIGLVAVVLALLLGDLVLRDGGRAIRAVPEFARRGALCGIPGGLLRRAAGRRAGERGGRAVSADHGTFDYRSHARRRVRSGAGVLIAVALITGLMAFSTAGPPPSVVHSRTAPYVVDAARLVASMAPHEVREGFRKTYGQVKSAWGKTLEDGIRKLPGSEKRHDERKI